MTELFPNISKQVRDYASIVWDLAKGMNPEAAVAFLDTATKNFSKEGLNEEADFLRFYFNVELEKRYNLQMETMKE